MGNSKKNFLKLSVILIIFLSCNVPLTKTVILDLNISNNGNTN